jgi:hypothetical protein
VGVRQALNSQVALLGSYGETSTGVTAKALGVAYSISKSLTLHGRWANIDNVTSVADIKQYGVGIEYNF